MASKEVSSASNDVSSSNAPSNGKETSTPKAKVGRPKGRHKEETLAKLLPVARKHFAERGFAQTTYKEISKDIGVTHAAIYSYFSSKQELYLATLANTQALLLPEYLAAIETGGNLRERISGILLASARAHDQDSTITGFLAAVPIEMRRHPELHEALVGQNDALMQAIEATFEEAKSNGEIQTNASAQELVTAIFGGGVGVALFHYGVQQEGGLTKTMEVFVSLLEGTLLTS